MVSTIERFHCMVRTHNVCMHSTTDTCGAVWLPLLPSLNSCMNTLPMMMSSSSVNTVLNITVTLSLWADTYLKRGGREGRRRGGRRGGEGGGGEGGEEGRKDRGG